MLGAQPLSTTVKPWRVPTDAQWSRTCGPHMSESPTTDPGAGVTTELEPRTNKISSRAMLGMHLKTEE